MVVEQPKKIAINLLSGFLLSLLGTIPLGFINLVALQIFTNNGELDALYFACGVILVELVVIKLTMSGAQYLLSKQKTRVYIELFSFLFILGFAIAGFLSNHNGKSDLDTDFAVASVHPFFYGIFLGCLNPIQIPFWAGWNIYMINRKRLIPKKPFYYFYMFGTAFGTLIGMIVFVLSARYMLNQSKDYLQNASGKIIPWIFLTLAVWQGAQMIYHYNKNRKSIK